MDSSVKTATKYIIIFSVVILIGLGSLVSMLIYSLTDRGTPSDKPIILENAEVQMYQSIGANYIKLEFYNVTEEKTQNYEVILLDEKGKELESLLVTIDLKPEGMDTYIYEAKTLLDNVCFYKIEPIYVQAN